MFETLALLTSFAISGAIVFFAPRVDALLKSSDLTGPQKFHTRPTPRIGGIAIFFTFFIVLWVKAEFIAINNFFGLLVAAIPVFASGIAEDITTKIPPAVRISGSVVSIVIAFYWLGTSVDSLGFSSVDHFLSDPVISLLFTLLVVSGAINAFNIIDGYNGLMAGYSVLILLAIIYIASIVGDGLIMELSTVLLFSILGFFILNFPFGKIFIGDGGAYFVGFLISIIGLMLGIRNEEVSHWFILLLFIYPLYETVFSIYRKKIIRKTSPSQPDGYHLHMLIYKRVVKCKTFKGNKIICNSMTSPFLWILSLAGIVPAVIWYDDQSMLIVWAFVFMVIYTIIYRRIVHFRFKK